MPSPKVKHKLLWDGYAPIIVLTGFEKGSATPPPRLTWRADYLAAHGVPRSVLRFEIGSRNRWWSPGEWWRDELSGSFVIMEYIKLAYYIVKR